MIDRNRQKTVPDRREGEVQWHALRRFDYQDLFVG
jgi:hypothetical protein